MEREEIAMWVHAIHNETDLVVIILIQSGSPKDYTELMIVYFDPDSGVLGCDDNLANFVITE